VGQGNGHTQLVAQAEDNGSTTEVQSATTRPSNSDNKKRNDSIARKLPTPEDPLPVVDMSRVPEKNRPRIGIIMDELREPLKTRKQSNQNERHVASFPWQDLEHKWPPPNSLATNLSHVDYLLPFLGVCLCTCLIRPVHIFLPEAVCRVSDTDGARTALLKQ
jgi:hypothetical protein